MVTSMAPTARAKVADVPDETPKVKEIRVSVNRNGSRPVGVRVQIEVGSLTVLEIQAGLIKSWNDENPTEAVHPGDEIASVNGHTTQSEILTELQLTRQKLDIVFMRKPATAEAPEFSALLVRSAARRDLGMDIEQDSHGIVVSKVRAGLVRDWNNSQSMDSQTIKPGTRIVAVNGLKDAREIRRELQSASTICIAMSSRVAQRRRSSSSSGELVKVVQLPFVKASDCGKGDEQQVCGICLDDVDADSCVVRLACTHIFHVECATKWLTKCNCACPVCRSPVRGSISERTPPAFVEDVPDELERPRPPSLVRA